MASVATKSMTAEEFYDFVNRPENRDRRFELEEGEIVEMSRPGELHCVVCGNTAYLFGGYVRKMKRGRVCPNDMGLVLQRDPDIVRGVDVAVYTDKKPYDELSQKYPEELPKLAVEVMSPNDRLGRMIRRIESFLEKGVPMVWLLLPERRTLTIFRRNQETEDYGETDTLKAIPELPRFRCRVAEFFEVPGA